MTLLSGTEFEGLFDRFAASATSRTVFRWESLQTYDVPDVDASLVAFRTGGPWPVRSITTDPWLARIARSTLLGGKTWSRVRYVAEPLTEYTEWELLTHAEAQVAGDVMWVVRERLTDRPDFWLFSGERRRDNYAVLMHYDDRGRPHAFEYVDEPDELAALASTRGLLLTAAEPLNAYLAHRREVLGAH